ncbi:glycosyltransferase family 2 protein [Fluviicola chungangensis]|uniref:Glycosyltransferase family 2 protein n=1 Tax=Fluviicola chungangensis TaxID=2597671 RepID=A0A556MIX8_9FLAO|nr:glycosyltransferase family 2 protein [Fluviicola chungangensis]TSJ39874.1 glycosyltransferase family 2 protein [Fluviicola chungangensis]
MIPDISICVITYNHESYIWRALESINFQKFNGSVELIIGVDVSSDRTAELVEQFVKISRFSVQAIIHTERQGMFENLYDVFRRATGKYIAVLEGDDFWVDEEKLYKQFVYMENAPLCVAAGGGIRTLTQTIRENRKWYNRKNQYYFLPDFIHANRMSFCTVMFRRECLRMDLFASLSDSPHLDWPIYIILLLSHPDAHIKVFSDVFSTYRIHDSGVYSGVNEAKRKQNILRTMQHISTLAANSSYTNYIDLSVHYQNDKTATCPTISALKKHQLDIGSIPSFYLHNFSKKQILAALIKSLWQVPQLLPIIWRKYVKRYSEN